MFNHLILLLCFVVVSTIPHFKIEVLHKPMDCKRLSQYGDQMFVHFIGWKMKNLEEFDRSHKDKPYRFQLGTGEVIEGFDEGLLGMCSGEKRKLTVPANMAYGQKGGHLPQMPAGMLIFEVELIHAEEGPRHPKVFKKMDLDGDTYLSKFELKEFLQGEVRKAEGEQMSPADEIEIVRNIMNQEDVNKDGYISLHEFSGKKHDEF